MLDWLFALILLNLPTILGFVLFLGALYLAVLVTSVAWRRGGGRTVAAVNRVEAPEGNDEDNRQHVAFQLQYLSKSPAIRVACVFLLHLADRVWTTLNLTPEERAIVETCPTRPVGAVVELWGEEFVRWRILQCGRNGEEIALIRDLYPERVYADGDEFITLWEVKLPGAASIKLEYSDSGMVYFAAVGGRFGTGPHPFAMIPQEEHTVFEVPLPLHGHVLRGQDEELRRFLKPSEPPLDREIPRYLQRPRLEVYECADEEKGFGWELRRYDMRPVLRARTTKIEPSGAGAYFTIQDVESGVEFATSSVQIEQGKDRRVVPRPNEVVQLVLDEEFKVARIWLEEPDSDLDWSRLA